MTPNPSPLRGRGRDFLRCLHVTAITARPHTRSRNQDAQREQLESRGHRGRVNLWRLQGRDREERCAERQNNRQESKAVQCFSIHRARMSVSFVGHTTGMGYDEADRVHGQRVEHQETVRRRMRLHHVAKRAAAIELQRNAIPASVPAIHVRRAWRQTTPMIRETAPTKTVRPESSESRRSTAAAPGTRGKRGLRPSESPRRSRCHAARATPQPTRTARSTERPARDLSTAIAGEQCQPHDDVAAPIAIEVHDRSSSSRCTAYETPTTRRPRRQTQRIQPVEARRQCAGQHRGSRECRERSEIGRGRRIPRRDLAELPGRLLKAAAEHRDAHESERDHVEGDAAGL